MKTEIKTLDIPDYQKCTMLKEVSDSYNRGIDLLGKQLSKE